MVEDEAPITGCVGESSGDLVRKVYSPPQTHSVKIPGNPNRANPTEALVQELRPLSVVHVHRDSTFYPHFKALSWEAVSILIGIFLTDTFECYYVFLFQ